MSEQDEIPGAKEWAKDYLKRMKLNILVWDIIFYTEDEHGTIRKYRPHNNVDMSHIAESVEMEDLEEIGDGIEVYIDKRQQKLFE